MLLVLASCGLASMAQVADPEYAERFSPKARALGIGAAINTNGLAFHVRYFKRLGNSANELVFDGWLSSLRDSREVRVESAFQSQGGKSFVWDKRNYAYTMGFTTGFQRIIAPLNSYNRFSLRVGLEGGLVLGFLKPYYIEYYQTNSSARNPLVVEQFDIRKHDQRFIVGEADYFTGFSETTVTPGLRLGAFTTANLAGSSFYIRALHVGIRADFYTRRMEIRDSSPDRWVFVGAHAGILIGNAW